MVNCSDRSPRRPSIKCSVQTLSESLQAAAMAKVVSLQLISERDIKRCITSQTTAACLNCLSDMTMQKTIVEAFVKMVVCRRITVQKVALTDGHVLESHTTQEEDTPVMLNVTRHETSDICARSPSTLSNSNQPQSDSATLDSEPSDTAPATYNHRAECSDHAGRDDRHHGVIEITKGGGSNSSNSQVCSSSNRQTLIPDIKNKLNNKNKHQMSKNKQTSTDEHLASGSALSSSFLRIRGDTDAIQMDCDSSERKSIGAHLKEINEAEMSEGSKGNFYNRRGNSVNKESCCSGVCSHVDGKSEMSLVIECDAGKDLMSVEMDTVVTDNLQADSSAHMYDSIQGLEQSTVAAEESQESTDSMQPCLAGTEFLSTDTASTTDSKTGQKQSDSHGTSEEDQSSSSFAGLMETDMIVKGERWAVQVNTDAASMDDTEDDVEMTVAEDTGSQNDRAISGSGETVSQTNTTVQKMGTKEFSSDKMKLLKTSDNASSSPCRSRLVSSETSSYTDKSGHRSPDNEGSQVPDVSGSGNADHFQNQRSECSLIQACATENNAPVTTTDKPLYRASSSPSQHALERLDPFAHLFESSFPPLDKTHDNIASSDLSSQRKSHEAQRASEKSSHQRSGTAFVSSDVKEEAEDDCMITGAYNITPARVLSSQSPSEPSGQRRDRGSIETVSAAGYSGSGRGPLYSTDREAMASPNIHYSHSGHYPNFLTAATASKFDSGTITTDKNLAHTPGHNFAAEPGATDASERAENVLCVECSQSFSSSEELFSHVCEPGQSTPPPQEALSASACGGAGQRHPTSHWSSNASHVCPMCSKCFWSRQTLHQHLITHTGQRQFGCHICGKRFKQRAHLATHLKFHMGVKRYRCEQCSQGYVQKGDLMRHLRSRAHIVNAASNSD